MAHSDSHWIHLTPYSIDSEDTNLSCLSSRKSWRKQWRRASVDSEKLLHAAAQHVGCMSTSIKEGARVVSKSTEIHLQKVPQVVMNWWGRFLRVKEGSLVRRLPLGMKAFGLRGFVKQKFCNRLRPHRKTECNDCEILVVGDCVECELVKMAKAHRPRSGCKQS
jgi:hypothetical protein